jgi:hypothetical protein
MLKEEGSYMKQHAIHKLDNAASVIDTDSPADDPGFIQLHPISGFMQAVRIFRVARVGWRKLKCPMPSLDRQPDLSLV